MEARGVYLDLDYVDLLDGDIYAGLMLSQIVYWCMPSKSSGKSKLRVCKEGIWWLSKSHRDWERECRLSRRQSSRCLKVLETKGLIATHLFTFNGAPTVHLRLSILQGMNLLSRAPSAAELASVTCAEACDDALPIATKGTFSIAPQGASHCPELCKPLAQNGQSITESPAETTPENVQIACDKSHTDPDCVLTNAGPTVHNAKAGEQKRKKNGETAKLCEIGKENEDLKSPTGKPNLKATEGMVKVHGEPAVTLGAHWNGRMALIQGKTQKPLTVKENSQLKAFGKLVSGAGSDPKAVIDYALRAWKKFGSSAMHSAGLYRYPSDPHVGFLLKHWNVAAKGYQHSVESKPEEPSPPSVPAVPAPNPKLTEENRKSFEDMRARFAADGEQCPDPTFNNDGELIYKLTNKERTELLCKCY